MFICGGTSVFAALPTGDVGDGQWHQAGFVFQGGTTDSTVTFYFDGAQLGTTQTLTGVARVAAQTENWHLIEDSGDSEEYYADGLYDESALWTRALSASEMQSLYDDGLEALVPEPTSLALLGAGGLVLLGRRRRSMGA